ncbi:MAG: efflux RND transporter periplasmic adaptor subunit [Pseudoxanthomonas sp.]
MPSENPSPRRAPRRAAVVAAAVLVLVAAGLAVRAYEQRQVAAWTRAQATPVVTVVKVSRGGEGDVLRLPAHLGAWSQAPIHARVSGYLKAWYADIGSPVKAGQVLAEIDSPELGQQIAQAQAKLLQARADAQIARTSAERWQQMLASHSVSRQEADEKQAAASAAEATVAAAAADYARLQELGAYRQVRAPFAGTVTARRVDIGQLVHADDSGAALFDLADNHRLRLMVPVPQNYAASIHPGMSAQVSVPDRPGHQYSVVLLGDSAAIDRASGTLLAQFAVDNPQGELLPGSYAEVALPLAAGDGNISIPASALIFRAQGTQVAVLEAGGKVALRKVHVALDLGDSLEIDQGLKDGEQVIDSPPDALRDGDPVRVAQEDGAHAQA